LPPNFSHGKLEPLERLGKNFATVSGLLRQEVMSISNRDRIPKMLVKMVDKFQDTILHRAGDTQKVEDCEVLDIFA
jgi:hypothetical protein